jgi:cell division protein ftsA
MLRKMNVRIGSPKIIGANSPELSVVVGTLTSSYKIESLFGYQVTEEIATIKNTNSTFENVSSIEEVNISKSRVEPTIASENHIEDNEQEVYYEDEDNEEKDDKEQGLFSKLSKMYNSFFE